MGMFAMVSFAQDVIVKKDGTTILSKVEEVSDTQVKYKKYSNLNGPTYSVNVIDLQCINYENGEKETFNSTPDIDTTAPVTITNYSNSSFSNSGERKLSDAELLKMYRSGSYNKGTRLAQNIKKAGYIVGGTLVTAGLVFILLQPIDGPGATDDTSDPLVGGILCGSGVVLGGGLLIASSIIKNKYERMDAISLYQYNIPLGKNTMLTADVDLIKDNMTRQQTLGLGFHLNF